VGTATDQRRELCPHTVRVPDTTDPLEGLPMTGIRLLRNCWVLKDRYSWNMKLLPVTQCLALGQYLPVVRFDRFLFLSAQTGVDQAAGAVPEGGTSTWRTCRS
jgi:hypothetical protein